MPRANTAPRPVIHDCDPGLDDAVALLLALASPAEVDVLGVTPVAGNVPLELTARNARQILELAGRRDIPVCAGCARPFLKALDTAADIHGDTGLAGVELPAPKLALDRRHGADFIIETVRARDGVTLCPTGPLTTIALALLKAPDIAPRICEIVLMGGAMAGGNITPVAEFNFYVDPHAAQTVFASGIPIVMMGLDVTHQVITTPQRLAAVRAIGSRVGDAVAGLLGYFPFENIERYGAAGGPLHDPCVMAYLIRPELFAGKDCHVEIVTDTGPAQGQSIVDWWGAWNRPANARVINQVDAEGFYALLLERLARL